MVWLSKSTFLPARRATVPRFTASVIEAALRKLPGDGSPPWIASSQLPWRRRAARFALLSARRSSRVFPGEQLRVLPVEAGHDRFPRRRRTGCPRGPSRPVGFDFRGQARLHAAVVPEQIQRGHVRRWRRTRSGWCRPSGRRNRSSTVRLTPSSIVQVWVAQAWALTGTPRPSVSNTGHRL